MLENKKLKDKQLSAGDPLEGKGKVWIREYPGKRHPKVIALIGIPAELARDSNFPFKNKERVIVSIDTKRKGLIIAKETTN